MYGSGWSTESSAAILMFWYNALLCGRDPEFPAAIDLKIGGGEGHYEEMERRMVCGNS